MYLSELKKMKCPMVLARAPPFAKKIRIVKSFLLTIGPPVQFLAAYY